MLLFGLYFVLIVNLFVVKEQSPQKKGVEQGPQKKTLSGIMETFIGLYGTI